jgi:hypothetical protein
MAGSTDNRGADQPRGLWTPPTGVGLLRMRATERTLTLPSGERAKVTTDDSGTVEHTETAERLDVKVSPGHVTVKVPPSLQGPMLAMLRAQGVSIRGH